MSRFIDDAVEILNAAEHAMNSGHTPSPYTILLGSQCGIHLVAGSDWPLESLQREHGADTAYRIQTNQGRVLLDGREGARTCHLETQSPAHIAHVLLNSGSRWYGDARATLPA